MITKKVIFHFFLPVIIIIFMITCASGESELDVLLSGNIKDPVTVRITSPAFQQLSQFSSERNENLNKILNHFSINIRLDGSISETTVSSDQTPLFSVKEFNTEGKSKAVYSFQPDTVYQKTDNAVSDHSFVFFLDNQFFLINRILDQFYPMFTKASTAFPEYSKEGVSGMNYREYGKAIRKIIIQFPSDYVKEHFPKVISDLCETEESRFFTEQFLYKGAQRITLLFDQNEKLMYVSYSGILGKAEESMRRVNFTWRCLRTENIKKDQVVLKTPAVKGYDKYNMTYDRELNLTDPVQNTVEWSFQLDLRDGEEKKKVQYSADLGYTDQKLEGTVQYAEKHNGQESTYVISPVIKKELNREYNGTIEISSKKGKIITSRLTSLLHISPSAVLSAADLQNGKLTDLDGEAGKPAAEALQTKMNGIIIRGLLDLPAEDLLFLRQDIPDDDWNAIIQSLFIGE